MKEAYEMTLIQYTAHLLKQNKYRGYYKRDTRAMESFKANCQDQWIQLILDRAKEAKLADCVIRDFVKRFGQDGLYRTFRGIYEKGIIGWIPADVKAYNGSERIRRYGKTKNFGGVKDE